MNKVLSIVFIFCFFANAWGQSSFNGSHTSVLEILQQKKFHIGDISIGQYMKDISKEFSSSKFEWLVETTKDSSLFLVSIRKDNISYAYWEINVHSGLVQYVNNNRTLCQSYELDYDVLLGVYAQQIGTYVDNEIIEASISANQQSSMIVFTKRNVNDVEKDPNEFMMGRELVERPKIPKRLQKSGKVVVKIKVSKMGNVIHAEFVPKGSTTLEGKLITYSIKNAFDAKYSPSEIDGVQVGQIVFDFNGESKEN